MPASLLFGILLPLTLPFGDLRTMSHGYFEPADQFLFPWLGQFDEKSGLAEAR